MYGIYNNFKIKFVWVAYIICICLLAIVIPAKYQASTIYFSGAKHWLAGIPLYTDPNFTFPYFPQTALLYSFLIKLPSAFYEISFRLFSLSLLWYGIYRIASLNQ